MFFNSLNFIRIIEDNRYECHANVISACSPLFERMLDSNMKEGIERKITLKDVTPQRMKMILDYMYIGIFTLYYGCYCGTSNSQL